MTARLAITPNQALTEWLDLTRRLQAGIDFVLQAHQVPGVFQVVEQ